MSKLACLFVLGTLGLASASLRKKNTQGVLSASAAAGDVSDFEPSNGHGDTCTGKAPETGAATKTDCEALCTGDCPAFIFYQKAITRKEGKREGTSDSASYKKGGTAKCWICSGTGGVRNWSGWDGAQMYVKKTGPMKTLGDPASPANKPDPGVLSASAVAGDVTWAAAKAATNYGGAYDLKGCSVQNCITAGLTPKSDQNGLCTIGAAEAKTGRATCQAECAADPACSGIVFHPWGTMLKKGTASNGDAAESSNGFWWFAMTRAVPSDFEPTNDHGDTCVDKAPETGAATKIACEALCTGDCPAFVFYQQAVTRTEGTAKCWICSGTESLRSGVPSANSQMYVKKTGPMKALADPASPANKPSPVCAISTVLNKIVPNTYNPDIANNVLSGTQEECIQACACSPTCNAFSWQTSKAPTDTGPCWLKTHMVSDDQLVPLSTWTTVSNFVGCCTTQDPVTPSDVADAGAEAGAEAAAGGQAGATGPAAPVTGATPVPIVIPQEIPVQREVPAVPHETAEAGSEGGQADEEHYANLLRELPPLPKDKVTPEPPAKKGSAAAMVQKAEATKKAMDAKPTCDPTATMENAGTSTVPKRGGGPVEVLSGSTTNGMKHIFMRANSDQKGDFDFMIRDNKVPMFTFGNTEAWNTEQCVPKSKATIRGMWGNSPTKFTWRGFNVVACTDGCTMEPSAALAGEKTQDGKKLFEASPKLKTFLAAGKKMTSYFGDEWVFVQSTPAADKKSELSLALQPYAQSEFQTKFNYFLKKKCPTTA